MNHIVESVHRSEDIALLLDVEQRELWNSIHMLIGMRLNDIILHWRVLQDGAPTFADPQHSQVNGALMFVDTPFRFEVQYLAKKLQNVVRHDHFLLLRTESCIHVG